jgi:hypothetical protein
MERTTTMTDDKTDLEQGFDSGFTTGFFVGCVLGAIISWFVLIAPTWGDTREIQGTTYVNIGPKQVVDAGWYELGSPVDIDSVLEVTGR